MHGHLNVKSITICEKRLLASLCLPVRLSVRTSARNNSAPNVRIFMKFYIFGMFRKSVKKIQVSLKYDDIGGHFT